MVLFRKLLGSKNIYSNLKFIRNESHIRIVEVGPRDGLQNEAVNVPTDVKIELIDRLSETGLETIEVTSFVSPKWVPQMADNNKVFSGISKKDNISYPVLVPNLQGLESAINVGVQEIAVFLSASEGFSKKNINCTVQEGIDRVKDVIDKARENNLKVRGYISCVVGCPYDGHVKPSAVSKVAEALLSHGCYELSLGDTIGVGTKITIENMLYDLINVTSADKLAIHCHDTYGQALVNIYTALEKGVRVVDASVSGLGGCPYAKGATGNVATEDLVYMLHGLGAKTGIDLKKLVRVGRYISDFLNRPPMSKVKMKINAIRMSTPIEEKVDQKLKVRTGMVTVSDGKSRPTPVQLNLSMEVLRLQKEEPLPVEPKPLNSKERMVQIRRQKVGGLGLSIKGGAEHKLPILISRIYKSQAAEQTGELFVGDAIIKVNGEYITACPHDDAVNILRNAGDLVVLTVKHYKAATPFLQKQDDKDSQQTDSNSEKEASDESFRITSNSTSSRPSSICSEMDQEPIQTHWVDIITVPLMMAYVTRYIFGTDKLRPNSFEVRGLNGISTGIIHCDDSAILSQWLKYISDNIIGLTSLQMKLYNRNFSVSDRIEYMGWVNECVLNNNQPWQNYKPRFLALKGTDLMLFDSPPLNLSDWNKCSLTFKVYQTMFRIVKESENVDERQHCFLVQTSGQESRYFSVETRQELLRIENAWHCSVCTAVMKLGTKTFTVSSNGKTAGLTLDWNLGFSLHERDSKTPVWQYKFSQLRGSSDDGKSKLKLHFQDIDTKAIETKELECSILQSLLYCMHAFLTAKVASVDPGFLCSTLP